MPFGPAQLVLPSASSSPSVTCDSSGTDENGSFDQSRHDSERNDTLEEEYDQIMLDRRRMLERHEAEMARITRKFQSLMVRMEHEGLRFNSR